MFNSKLKKELESKSLEVTEYKGLIAALDRSMAIIEFGLDGKVIRANDNFLSVMGYRADQIKEMSHRDFCTPVLVRSPKYEKFWSQLRSGEFVSGTFQRVDAKGQTVWLEASYNPILDREGKVSKGRQICFERNSEGHQRG
ncbi:MULTISPECIES: PAS domain-containing protein [unclassified Pseudomonas]|uniref:PAS domain-containing protein n=1 Tax=unclassified Pseudomonas TaxID=196821 RepID=UPI001FD61CDF